MPRRPHPRPPLSLSRLRDVGFSLWDSIGVLPPGEPWDGHPAADEYDSYLTCAASLLRDGTSDAECVRMPLEIETRHMGLADKPPPGSTDRVGKVVAAIRGYVEELDEP